MIAKHSPDSDYRECIVLQWGRCNPAARAALRSVIYLTLSMNVAVRALNLLLIVWLTASASFPPCCWSMVSAHDHQARPTAAPGNVQSHDHHHHDMADSAVPAAPVPAVSPIAHDCDTAFIEAVTTPRTSFSSVDFRPTGAGSANLVVTQVSVTWRERRNSDPPGGSSRTAFLNPLRL
jgi:hypothetical protein